MERYHAFSGYDYEASGGWNDWRCSGDNLDEVENNLFASKEPMQWWHIVDLQTGEIVRQGNQN